MAAFPFQIVGFDLDGTLVDSNRDLAPAVNHALSTVGRPAISADATRKLIGGGARRMLERAFELTGGALPETEFETAYGELLVHYEAHIADHTVSYPGCLEALDALLERGCKLAVITNKIEVYSKKLLGALGLTDRFALILGGDTLGPGRAKPAPDMIDTAILTLGGGSFAMVGDSTYDVRAARNARVPVVALSFGYNDAPAAELGADAVIDHYDELVGALERLRRVLQKPQVDEGHPGADFQRVSTWRPPDRRKTTI
jgi:phosphoglycolate phosphatase